MLYGICLWGIPEKGLAFMPRVCHTCQEISYCLQVYVPILPYASFERGIYGFDVDSRGYRRGGFDRLLGQR